MSDAAHRRQDEPRGTSLLPPDLNDEQLAAAPVVADIDDLLIEDLSEEEAEAFFAALAE